jgi:hypothetical protein
MQALGAIQAQAPSFLAEFFALLRMTGFEPTNANWYL